MMVIFMMFQNGFFEVINETKDLTKINLNECQLFNPNSVGGVVMFDREHYWKCGGANEAFKSVGYEDNEINTRFKNLGTKINAYAMAIMALDTCTW